MPKAKPKAKTQSKQPRLRYPATRQDDMRRLTQELKRSPMWVKNFIYRPSHTRRSVKNNSLLLTKELAKSPMWVKNYLYRPSRTRKAPSKMKIPNLMKVPLGIKI